MPTRIVLLILLSLMLSACWPEGLTVTKPVGVPFDLPSHLRQCAEKTGTDPSTIKTVAQLLGACYIETIRLIDVHNAAVTSGKLAVTTTNMSMAAVSCMWLCRSERQVGEGALCRVACAGYLGANNSRLRFTCCAKYALFVREGE